MRGRLKSNETVPRESRNDYWGVVLDAPDAPALARFYVELLDWELASVQPDFATIGPGEGVAYMAFQTSPTYIRPVWPNAEGAQQIMMHLDIEVSDLEEAIAHAIELGAQQAEFQPQTNVRVMLDPAGHAFCLYRGDD